MDGFYQHLPSQRIHERYNLINLKTEAQMKININNEKMINAALHDGQKYSKERRVSIDEIRTFIKRLEVFLEGNLFKKDWPGVEVRVNLHAQSFPGAYRGIPMSTYFSLYRGSSDWFLTEVVREECGERKIFLKMPKQGPGLAHFIESVVKSL
jgi:hypothetical protein